MPRIVFEAVTVRPLLELMSDDYFYEPQPPGIAIPDSGPGNDIFERANRIVDGLLGNLGDMRFAALPVDLAGCDLGLTLANRVVTANRINGTAHSMQDFCREYMDDTEIGYMLAYNAHVERYAMILFRYAELAIPTPGPDRDAFIHEQYRAIRANLMGTTRGYHALLQCAYGVAATEADLDRGLGEPIVREGKLPADFV